MQHPESKNTPSVASNADVPAENRRGDPGLITMEYRTLREAIEKRVGIKYTMLQLNITILGGIIAFGFQYKNPIILLFYPFLTLWIAIVWSQNTFEIRNMSGYIITHVETQGWGPNWEGVNQTSEKTESRYDSLLKSLVVISDLAVLWVGITTLSQNIVLICFAALCTFFTILFLFLIARFKPFVRI